MGRKRKSTTPATSRRQQLRRRYPLSRRKILKKSIPKIGRPLFVALATALLIAVVFHYVKRFDLDDPTGFILKQEFPILLVYGALVVWLAWYPLYQFLYWRTYSYDADGCHLYIRKGVIIRKEAILPFSRITDVYLDQDFLDVVLGLYDLHFSTPTVESGKFAHIDGLSRAAAERLKASLLAQIGQARGELPAEMEEQLDAGVESRRA
ncbi:MAG: PH domain-containing protein [Bdellovibrionales bacterium]|nr:PH domain-containing protein [Bdellovibrionales bacterium]